MSLLSQTEPHELTEAEVIDMFEKQANAENIDLASLDDQTYGELFEVFVNNTFVEEAQKEAAAEEAAVLEHVNEKLASLSEEDVAFLFYKQAEAEGVSVEDVQNADSEKVAAAFGHFQQEVLPHMALNDWEPVATEAAVKHAEFSEKVAEADMLGRIMAQSFNDELEKQASAGAKIRSFGKALGDAATGARFRQGLEGRKATIKTQRAAADAATMAAGKHRKPAFRELAGERAGKLKRRAADEMSAAKKDLAMGALQTGGLYGAGALGLTGAGAGLYAASKRRSKTASAIVEELANERALEILVENGYEIE